MTRYVRVFVCAVFVSLVVCLFNTTAAFARRDCEDQLYVKRAFWGRTMVESRANIPQWFERQGGTVGSVAWMKQDLPEGAHLDWFNDSDSATVEWAMIDKVLKDTGPAENVMRKELKELQAGNAGSDDERWLSLYVKACRYRESLAMQKGLDFRGVRSVIDRIAKVSPEQYPHGDEYRKRLDDYEAMLLEIQNAVVRGDSDAPGRMADAMEEILAFQRQIVVADNPGFDFDELLVIKRCELNPTHVYTYHNEGFKSGGGLYRFKLDAQDGILTELVAAPTGQILDHDLSYDGKEVLFSWKKTEDDPYQVFLMNIDGTNVRQLTQGPSYNFNACWLPDGDIAFLSTRKPAFAYCWTSPVGIIYRMRRDGTGIKKLSANYLNDFTPSVTSDGRLIYSRWEYVDRPAIPIQSLWTVNPDGTNLSAFFGNRVLSPATFMEPRSIPGTSRILCVLTAHNGPCRGAIGTIDPAHGLNAQKAIVNLTPEVDIGKVDEGDGNRIRGPYESPYPIDEEYFLVSRRGTILLRDYAGTIEIELLRGAGPIGYYSAQPIRPRRKPPVHNSLVFGDEDAGNWATVVMQDVYQGLRPYVKRGEVEQICVVQEIEKPKLADKQYRAFGFQFPVVSCGATYAPKKIWGYAKVEADGSAAFKVPTGIPVYFMALDKYGRAVQRMRSFTNFMPGEVRGCIGCHESRKQVSRMRKRPLAALKPPQDLVPPEWGVAGFSYAHIVQPVLDKHCVKCHSGPAPPKKLDLSGDKTDYFNVSYENLARRSSIAAGGRRRANAEPYTKWIPTYNGQEANILLIKPKTWGSPASILGDIVFSGHPDENGKARVDMDDVSRRRIFTWMDLNVPYYGTSMSNHYERKGCRRMMPLDLDEILAEVANRRCAGCHTNAQQTAADIPREFYVRVTNPRLNNFLTAPLAKSAGGTQACSRPVFQSTTDPDYQAIMNTFKPIHKTLTETPRMDMCDYTKCPKPIKCEKKLTMLR